LPSKKPAADPDFYLLSTYLTQISQHQTGSLLKSWTTRKFILKLAFSNPARFAINSSDESENFSRCAMSLKLIATAAKIRIALNGGMADKLICAKRFYFLITFCTL
jgi:hypothetical protein